MTINERVRTVRKVLNLTQADFGKRLAIAQSYLTNIETGKREVTEKIQKLICLEFNVSEKWLLTEQGEMFVKSDSAIISQLSAEYGLDAFEKDLIEGFLKLRPEERKVIKSYVSKLKKSLLNAAQEDSQPLQHSRLTVVEPSTKSEREDWEREADEFAAIARAQFLQEKKRESQAQSAPKSDAG